MCILSFPSSVFIAINIHNYWCLEQKRCRTTQSLTLSVLEMNDLTNTTLCFDLIFHFDSRLHFDGESKVLHQICFCNYLHKHQTFVRLLNDSLTFRHQSKRSDIKTRRSLHLFSASNKYYVLHLPHNWGFNSLHHIQTEIVSVLVKRSSGVFSLFQWFLGLVFSWIWFRSTKNAMTKCCIHLELIFAPPPIYYIRAGKSSLDTHWGSSLRRFNLEINRILKNIPAGFSCD